VFIQYAVDTNQKYLLWKKSDFWKASYVVSFTLQTQFITLVHTVCGITNDNCDVSTHSNILEIKFDPINLEQTKRINFIAF
jgi:hypothetical protein